MSGVADLPMADQLYHYMVGGHKRPLVCNLISHMHEFLS